MSKILHNPKSHAPAVYIPCWLIQVPIELLSHGAKILYGRLSQWANEKGIVYRSVSCLAEEIGTSPWSVEKYLKELRDVSLIGTYRQKSGGVNHFEFYDHDWMHCGIKDQLVYKSDRGDPPEDLTAPPGGSYGTPPEDLTALNKKEIERNKNKDLTTAHEEKKSSLSFSEMEKENPHSIPEELIKEWILNRKSQKAKITSRVWARTNKVLFQLNALAINPLEAFERMVCNNWRSIEVSYFERDIRSQKNNMSNSSEFDLVSQQKLEFGF